MAEICPDCGMRRATTFGGFGCAAAFGEPYSHACAVRVCDMQIVELRSQLAKAQAELAERKRECEAWAALATHRVAGYASEFSSTGEEGTEQHEYVFGAESRGTGNWYEATGSTLQAAAIGLATELGLLPEPPKASET